MQIYRKYQTNPFLTVRFIRHCANLKRLLVARLGHKVAAPVAIEKDMKLIFPIHPRTRKNIKGTDLGRRVEALEKTVH